MLHGVSLVHVNNDLIQEALARNASSEYIAKLKADVAFNCVYGFEYYEVPFNDLANLLNHDAGFNNFKFKDVTTAVYDKEKHPNAYGLVRGVYNIISGCSWVWFDIDTTTITDIEMHKILTGVKHHIARTSNKNNPLKYRIIVELSKPITITRDEWKPFIGCLAKQLGIGKIDKLAQSQIAFGYKGREVLSDLTGKPVDPTTCLNMARLEVAKRAEEEATYTISSTEAERALTTPFTTFNYAYTAEVGDRWKTSMAAIQHAKRLGASKEYIKELMYAINDFLDEPKSRRIVEQSLFSAI
jgi:hypothetical protein